MPAEKTSRRTLVKNTREAVQVYYVQVKNGTVQVVEKVGNSVKSLQDSARAVAEPRVQLLRPYYVKVHDGVAHVAATIGNVPVVMRVKVSEVSGGIHAQFIRVLTA